jgi:hypothetical protein
MPVPGCRLAAPQRGGGRPRVPGGLVEVVLRLRATTGGRQRPFGGRCRSVVFDVCGRWSHRCLPALLSDGAALALLLKVVVSLIG